MVYVDQLKPCRTNRRWPWKESCHLIADTRAQLLDFGERMGLRADWFQNGEVPHFDLTAGMRARAVRLGAMPLEDGEFVKVIRNLRPRAEVPAQVADGTIPF